MLGIAETVVSACKMSMYLFSHATTNATGTTLPLPISSPTLAVALLDDLPAVTPLASGGHGRTFSRRGPIHEFNPGVARVDSRVYSLYKDFLYVVPQDDDDDRLGLYLVTKGRRVGVFRGW